MKEKNSSSDSWISRVIVRNAFGCKEGFRSYGFYKAFCGRFDVHYAANDYYDLVEHVMNLRSGSFYVQHKCNLSDFLPRRHRPETVVRKINGHYCDEDNNEIAENEAVAMVRSEGRCVVKPALWNGGGRGVRLVEPYEVADDELKDLLSPRDVLVQRIVQQHPFMAKFSRLSVNTLRMLTLNINGRCTLCSSFIRMGAGDSFVDNLAAGGLLVGVGLDGRLSDWAITKQYAKVSSTADGLAFAGLVVPDFEAIAEKVCHFHHHIPYADLIGWDVAIDPQGEPVIIEMNLDSAEIEAHQVFNGPVFGDRSEEVREYLCCKLPTLHFGMLTF